MKREFTGVFIPAHIWTSKEITAIGKMLLAEIDALSQSTGWCYASRAHFAEWLGTTESNLSLHFRKLSDAGFLEIERIPGETNKMRVVATRFHIKEGVRKTYGGGKENLPVNTIEIKEEREGENAPAPGVETVSLNADFPPFPPVPAAPLSPTCPRWTPTNPDAEIAEMLKCPLCEERFVRDVRQRVTEFQKFAERFLLKVKSEGATHANRKDLRSHFFAWARLEAERSHGKPGIQNDKPAPAFVTPQTPIRFAK